MAPGALVWFAILCQTFCTFANPVSSPQEYDVIVVGLGAAGTAAASKLSTSGRRVLALEAQGRIGGRVKTVPFGAGIVEEGAEWIHGVTNSTTARLASDNNITLLEQTYSTAVYRSDGSQFDDSILLELVEKALEVQDDPPEVPEPMGQFITRRLNDYISEHHPALSNDADFLTEMYRFLDIVVQGYEAADSWNDVTTASTYKALEGSQDMSWHRHGYKTLFDILLNRYNNGPGIPTLAIKLATEVTSIRWSPEGSENVTVSTVDGTSYTAPHVIVTLGLGVLKEKHKAMFTPPLSSPKSEAIDQISFGVCDKAILRFPHAWWGGKSLAFLWRGEDRRAVSEDWLTGSDGIFPAMSTNDTVTSWFCGERAKKLEVTPDEEAKDKIMSLIRRFVGKDYDVPDPVEFRKSTWHTNPYTRGSYSYDGVSMPEHPNARAQLGAPLTDRGGVPRLLFAGEATNPTHFATVHGALDTGFREADRLLDLYNNDK